MSGYLIEVLIDEAQHKSIALNYGRLQTTEEKQVYLGEILAIYAVFLEESGEHMRNVIATVHKAVLLLLRKVLSSASDCDVFEPFIKQTEQGAAAMETAFNEYAQEDSFRRKDGLHKVTERMCTWLTYAIWESLTLFFVQEYSSEQIEEAVRSSSNDPLDSLCKRLFLAQEKAVNVLQYSNELLRYSPWLLKVMKLYALLTLACPTLCIPRMLLNMGYKHLEITAKAGEHAEYFYTDTSAVLSLPPSSHMLQDANYNYAMAFTYCFLACAYIHNDFADYPLPPEGMSTKSTAIQTQWPLLQPLLLIIFTDFVVLFSTFEHVPTYFGPLVDLLIDTLEEKRELDAGLKRLGEIRNLLSEMTVHITY